MRLHLIKYAQTCILLNVGMFHGIYRNACRNIIIVKENEMTRSGFIYKKKKEPLLVWNSMNEGEKKSMMKTFMN